MNWIYHIDLVSNDLVEDEAYAELLKNSEWFATPTLAKRAAELKEVHVNEPVIEDLHVIAEVEKYEQQKTDEVEIDEVIPAKPRKVKANGIHSKRTSSRSV